MPSKALPWALALALCSGPAAPFSISPTGGVIEGSAPRPMHFVVTAGHAPLAIEFSVVERHARALRESLQAAPAGTVDIRPSQVLLDAGQSAAVTVRWVGGSPGDTSRSFYVLAEELPLRDGPAAPSAGLRVLTRFHLPLHVRGTGTAALTVRRGEQDRFILANTGQQFVRLADTVLRVAGQPSGAVRSIPGATLARAAQADALLPGGTVEVDATSIGLERNEQVIGLFPRD